MELSVEEDLLLPRASRKREDFLEPVDPFSTCEPVCESHCEFPLEEVSVGLKFWLDFDFRRRSFRNDGMLKATSQALR